MVQIRSPAFYKAPELIGRGRNGRKGVVDNNVSQGTFQAPPKLPLTMYPFKLLLRPLGTLSRDAPCWVVEQDQSNFNQDRPKMLYDRNAGQFPFYGPSLSASSSTYPLFPWTILGDDGLPPEDWQRSNDVL